MTRAAAAKATEAADAVLDWLRGQPPPAVFRGRGPADRAPGDPDAGGPDAPCGTAAPGAEPITAYGAVDAVTLAATSASPGPLGDGRGATPRQATASGKGVAKTGGAPLRLAHTEWLHHRLVVTGPEAAVATFRSAAAGAGVIPWHLDLDRIAEDCFHRLVAPPSPHQRRLSLAGARIVAGQLRDAVARRHDLAVARVGHSRACPFDLHALVPVPADILRRGPDDADSLQWLWQHWGTTRELRHVAADTAAGQERRRRLAAGVIVWQATFWSADWSPWRALAQIAANVPALRFDLRPSYDAP